MCFAQGGRPRVVLVAVRVNFFQTLVEMGSPVMAGELIEAVDEERDEESKRLSPLCLPYHL